MEDAAAADSRLRRHDCRKRCRHYAIRHAAELVHDDLFTMFTSRLHEASRMVPFAILMPRHVLRQPKAHAEPATPVILRCADTPRAAERYAATSMPCRFADEP